MRQTIQSSSEGIQTAPKERLITSRVSDQPALQSDRFGNLVWAFIIENLVTTDDERYPDTPFVFRTSIDRSGGTWIIDDAVDYYYSSIRGLGVPSLAPPECKASVLDAGLPHYATSPLPFEFGTLMGAQVLSSKLSFLPGSRNLESKHDDSAKFLISHRDFANVSIDDSVQRLPTVTASISLRTHQTNPATYAVSATNSTRVVTYAAGVPLPIRSSFIEGTRTINSTLEHFWRGTSSLELGWGDPSARYFPPNPTWITEAIDFAPELDSLNLDFPFLEAFAALGTDPRGIPILVWLESHPNAYVWRTFYQSEQGRQECGFILVTDTRRFPQRFSERINPGLLSIVCDAPISRLSM